jgi:hypothetical protein
MLQAVLSEYASSPRLRDADQQALEPSCAMRDARRSRAGACRRVRRAT